MDIRKLLGLFINNVLVIVQLFSTFSKFHLRNIQYQFCWWVLKSFPENCPKNYCALASFKILNIFFCYFDEIFCFKKVYLTVWVLRLEQSSSAQNSNFSENILKKVEKSSKLIEFTEFEVNKFFVLSFRRTWTDGAILLMEHVWNILQLLEKRNQSLNAFRLKTLESEKCFVLNQKLFPCPSFFCFLFSNFSN